MGVEDTSGTDTRTETTDKPASQERPYTPPPDNPGSPGQPSRLESYARARQEQQESRSQETQDKDAGSTPREERDDRSASAQTGSGKEKAEPPARPEGEERRQDDGRPGTDQPGRQDRREGEPRSQDEGTTTGREPGTGTPGDRDRPQPLAAEKQADTRTEPADEPASSDRQWTPPPDNPGSPGRPSRLESLARTRDEQQAAAAQRDQTGVLNDSDRSTEQAPEDGPQSDPTAEIGDQPTPRSDTGIQDREPSDQRTTDTAPPSPEEMNQGSGTRELHIEQDGDRDKKAEEPETTEPADGNGPLDRGTGQSGEAEESGRELAPHEANTTEVEEPGRFHGRVTIPVDSDGRPLPSSRDTGNETPDRGAPRLPEDDPEGRDLTESDPERPDRLRDLRREMMRASPSLRKSVNENSKPAFEQFDTRRPETQPGVVRNNSDHIENSNSPIKAGDALVGVLGGIIVASELLRLTGGATKKLTGRGK